MDESGLGDFYRAAAEECAATLREESHRRAARHPAALSRLVAAPDRSGAGAGADPACVHWVVLVGACRTADQLEVTAGTGGHAGDLCAGAPRAGGGRLRF